MRTLSYGKSDVGRRRPHNEDSLLFDDQLGLYVVADGVGGNAKGEVASAESVELVQSWVKRWRKTLDAHVADPTPENSGRVRRLLESAKGMSSTLSSLLVCANEAFIAQVGDSRVYLAREGKTVQLTEDHTLVNFRLKLGLITPEEAANAPGKNVITRAVGHQDYVEVDTIDLQTRPGDRFMLCSDGLHGYLDDGEIDGLMLGEREGVTNRLIELANERGGRDNITAVVVDVEG